MKVRIKRSAAGMYYGEVYGTFENSVLNTGYTGWTTVTPGCLTKWGAERELQKWKDQNAPDEFEI